MATLAPRDEAQRAPLLARSRARTPSDAPSPRGRGGFFGTALAGHPASPPALALRAVAALALVAALTLAALVAGLLPGAPSLAAALGLAPPGGSDAASACKIVYYYHVPKTGGGSIVRYFGHLPSVNLLRYESTKWVKPENKTLWHWEHASAESHWDDFIVPEALKPGNHLIAHHWGRFGMRDMRPRLRRLRAEARRRGCDFMASTTFRNPVDRDVSEDVFRRMHKRERETAEGDANERDAERPLSPGPLAKDHPPGLGGDQKNAGALPAGYLGDEQLRFFLLNSKRFDDAFLPRAPLRTRPALRSRALRLARAIMREDFELVTTIEHLEAQKDAFVAFFGLGVTSPSPRTTATANASERDAAAAQKAAPEVGQTEAGDALAHVHRIDYVKEGVSEAEMARMRRAYADTNDADAQLYRLARALGGDAKVDANGDAKVDANADAKRDSDEGARAASAASTSKRRSKSNKFALGLEESPEVTALKAQIAALQAKLDAALRAKVVDQALVATLRAALDEARASRDAAVEAEAEAASAAIHELEVELERAEADLVLAKKAKAAGDAAVEAVQKAIDAGAAPEGEGEEKLEEAKRVREEAEAAVADAEAMVEDLERRIAALKTPNGAT
jgi:hypothetical protein